MGPTPRPLNRALGRNPYGRDSQTAREIQGQKAAFARVLVEVDISKVIVDEILIQLQEGEGFL